MTDHLATALEVARRTGAMQPTFADGQIAHAYPDGHVEYVEIPRDFPRVFGVGLGERGSRGPYGGM